MDLPALATFACVALHCSYHGWYHVMLQKSCGGTSEEDPLFFCGQGQKVSMPSRDDPRCGLKRVPGQKSRSSVLLVGGIQKANISGRYCRRLCHPDMTLSPRLRRGKLRRRVVGVSNQYILAGRRQNKVRRFRCGGQEEQNVIGFNSDKSFSRGFIPSENPCLPSRRLGFSYC